MVSISRSGQFRSDLRRGKESNQELGESVFEETKKSLEDSSKGALKMKENLTKGSLANLEEAVTVTGKNSAEAEKKKDAEWNEINKDEMHRLEGEISDCENAIAESEANIPALEAYITKRQQEHETFVQNELKPAQDGVGIAQSGKESAEAQYKDIKLKLAELPVDVDPTLLQSEYESAQAIVAAKQKHLNNATKHLAQMNDKDGVLKKDIKQANDKKDAEDKRLKDNKSKKTKSQIELNNLTAAYKRANSAYEQFDKDLASYKKQRDEVQVQVNLMDVVASYITTISDAVQEGADKGARKLNELGKSYGVNDYHGNSEKFKKDLIDEHTMQKQAAHDAAESGIAKDARSIGNVFKAYSEKVKHGLATGDGRSVLNKLGEVLKIKDGARSGDLRNWTPDEVMKLLQDRLQAFSDKGAEWAVIVSTAYTFANGSSAVVKRVKEGGDINAISAELKRATAQEYGPKTFRSHTDMLRKGAEPTKIQSIRTNSTVQQVGSGKAQELMSYYNEHIRGLATGAENSGIDSLAAELTSEYTDLKFLKFKSAINRLWLEKASNLNLRAQSMLLAKNDAVATIEELNQLLNMELLHYLKVNKGFNDSLSTSSKGFVMKITETKDHNHADFSRQRGDEWDALWDDVWNVYKQKGGRANALPPRGAATKAGVLVPPPVAT